MHIQLLRSFDVLRLSKDIDRQFKIRELALCYRRKARIFRAGADRVLNDLFGDVFPRRENRSDTAAQFAVFMDRNKYTGAFREKRVRNGMFYRSANGRVPGHGRNDTFPHKVFDGKARERRPWIFLFAGAFCPRLLCLQAPFKEVARPVLSADAERADAVSDAGNILMGKLLCLDTAAVERACHDDEAPVAAFCCFFKECGRKVKQAAKTSPAAHFHNLFVIGRAFLCVAIRAVRFELVGEISACDINGAPA